MVNAGLVKFIVEARKRGFSDAQITEPLVGNGWFFDEVEEAFASLSPRVQFKNKVCIYLDSEILKKLDKRAKKNMFTISEQIEDILRRSVVSSKGVAKIPEKLDDMLVALFSRKNRRNYN